MDDEELAYLLTNWLRNPEMAGRGKEQAIASIRSIGEALNRNGGFDRMKRVCDLVAAIGGRERLIDARWDRIGDWRG